MGSSCDTEICVYPLLNPPHKNRVHLRCFFPSWTQHQYHQNLLRILQTSHLKHKIRNYMTDSKMDLTFSINFNIRVSLEKPSIFQIHCLAYHSRAQWRLVPDPELRRKPPLLVPDVTHPTPLFRLSYQSVDPTKPTELHAWTEHLRKTKTLEIIICRVSINVFFILQNMIC